MSAPRAAFGEPRVAARIAGPWERDPIARCIPCAWEWLRTSPRALPDVGVDEAALKPKNRRSPKCGGAIRSILSTSRPIFFEAFSVLPINIIPKRKSPCSSREGALWASLVTRQFQLWHQGGAWDSRMRRCTAAKGLPIVASIQHALEIVAPGGDWKVLYKAWEG